MSQCACGCGREIDTSKSRGEAKKFYSDACRQRQYRKEQEQKRYVTLNSHVQKVKPLLRYPGSKWSLARWIASHLPPHEVYLEPYCGSAAVFFAKEPSEHEILNDLHSDIPNLFRVLRTRGPELVEQLELTPWSREEYYAAYATCEDEIEKARRFLVRCWQAHGTRLNGKTGWKHRGPSAGSKTASLWKHLPDRLLVAIDRLRDAEIECRPALEVIAEYPDACLYVDPPYELSTRNGAMYAHEMDSNAHSALLDVLEVHRGPVALSGYACDLYDARLRHWHRVTMPSLAEKGQTRTEVLWLNHKAARSQQLTLFEEYGT